MTNRHLLIAATVLATAMPLHAEPAQRGVDALPSIIVGHGDLDLLTARGRAIFHRRIVVAARRLCATDEAWIESILRPQQMCIAAIVAGAGAHEERALAASRTGEAPTLAAAR